MNAEKIKQGIQTIDELITRTIRDKHRQIMQNFLQTGFSNFVDRKKKIFIVSGRTAIPTEILIKLYPHIDGIVFSCVFSLLSETLPFVLFTKSGTITEYSERFPFKHADNIIDLFPTIQLPIVEQAFSTKVKRRFFKVTLKISTK